MIRIIVPILTKLCLFPLVFSLWITALAFFAWHPPLAFADQGATLVCLSFLERPETQDLPQWLEERHLALARLQLWMVEGPWQLKEWDISPLEGTACLQVAGEVPTAPPYDEPLTIGPASPEALVEARARFGAALASLGPVPERADGRVMATNPSIFVQETWDYVSGYTDPYTSVYITLTDSLGFPKAITSTYASSSGYYSRSFYSSGIDPADIVEVWSSSSGNTISMTVASLAAFFDLASDVITGTGPASSLLSLDFYHYSGYCSSTGYGRSPTTNASGLFSQSFAGTADLRGRDYLYLSYYDANGNRTQIYRVAPYLSWQRYPASQYVYGYSSPGADVFVALKDSSGNTRASASTTADRYGWFSAYLGTTPLSGETLEMTAGGQTKSLSLGDMTVNVNPDADTVSGNGVGPSQVVGIEPRHYYSPDWYISYTGCYETMTSSTSPYTYSRSLAGTVDLIRGDYAYVYAPDSDGDNQYGLSYAPVVRPRLGGNYVSGYLGRGSIPLTITVSSVGARGLGTSAATVAITATATSDGYYYGYIYDQGSTGNERRFQAGDVVQVVPAIGDPISTTVPVFTQLLSPSGDIIFGSGPANSNVYGWVSHWWDSTTSSYYITQPLGASGNYAIGTQPWLNLQSGDYSYLYLIGGDGHWIQQYAYSTSPTVTVVGYPSSFVPGLPGVVTWIITGGVHGITNTLRWGMTSYPYDSNRGYAYRAYPPDYGTAMGTYTTAITPPAWYTGYVYLRAQGSADRQTVWSPEYAIFSYAPEVLIYKSFIPVGFRSYPSGW